MKEADALEEEAPVVVVELATEITTAAISHVVTVELFTKITRGLTIELPTKITRGVTIVHSMRTMRAAGSGMTIVHSIRTMRAAGSRMTIDSDEMSWVFCDL
ncbi:hypothetical protein ABN254_21365 [Providencia rettgeri]